MFGRNLVKIVRYPAIVVFASKSLKYGIFLATPRSIFNDEGDFFMSDGNRRKSVKNEENLTY